MHCKSIFSMTRASIRQRELMELETSASEKCYLAAQNGLGNLNRLTGTGTTIQCTRSIVYSTLFKLPALSVTEAKRL